MRHSTARCCLFRMTATSSSALQPACCISKTKNLQKLLNTLEREISQLETQSSDLEQQMVDAASDSGKLLELMSEKEACDEKLAAKMDEWEAVAAELEELQ